MLCSSPPEPPPARTPPRRAPPRLPFPSSASPHGSGDLTTGGGRIQQRPVSYVVFWRAAWSASGSLTGDGQLAVNYLSDVGQTGYEKIVSQYYDSSAYISATHTLTPDWIDTTNPTTDTTCGAQTVQDTAIQHEVSHAIAVNGWPTDGANATDYVYTPTGYSVGVFHPSTGAMYLKNDATVGGGADFSFSYGGGNDVPVAGHWY